MFCLLPRFPLCTFPAPQLCLEKTKAGEERGAGGRNKTAKLFCFVVGGRLQDPEALPVYRSTRSTSLYFFSILPALQHEEKL